MVDFTTFEFDVRFNDLLIAVTLFIIYYLVKVAKKPSVLTSNNELRTFLINSCPAIQETFWPTIWAFDTRLQTAVRSVLQRHSGYVYDRQLVDLPDGGLIAFDWKNPAGYDQLSEEEKATTPIVVLLPGILGDSKESYVCHIVDRILMQGFRTAVFIYRGNGGLPLKTTRLYSGASCDDLASGLQDLAFHNPKAPLYGCGLSLGAILWYNYLAGCQPPKKPLVRACVTISMLWDMSHTAKTIETPLNYWILNRRLQATLLKKLRNHMSFFENDKEAMETYDFKSIFEGDRIRHFEERVLCPMFGFRTVRDYYEAVSPYKHFRSLPCPVVSINAADDPFAVEDSIPIKEIVTLPDSIEKEDGTYSQGPLALILTARGGHVGFAEGIWPSKTTWSDRVTGQLLSALHKYTQEKESFQPLANF